MNNWYLLAAIPVFGVLVLVHEFGHFITARWAGIRVEEFGLGLPPRLVGIRKRTHGGWEVMWFGGNKSTENSSISTVRAEVHTIYSLNVLPIGGFVRMPSENGDMNDAEGKYDEGSFAAKSAGKRIIVLMAGVAMNVLLAILLFTVAYGLGVPTFPAMVGTVQSHSPAQMAGLHADDTIVRVNGVSVKSFDDVVAQIDKSLTTASSTQTTVPITFVIRHSDSTTDIPVIVNARLHPQAQQWNVGIGAKEVLVQTPLWQAPFKGVVHTYEVTHEFLGAIGQMITGALHPQLAGPVGIVKITGEVAQSVPDLGWWPILSLTGILSLNLAIMNIVPFPALDGGRILLIVIELLRGGRRLKPEREGFIHLISMSCLLALMIVITVSDIMHWGS